MKTIDKLFYPAFLCVFAYAMFCLFLNFADYIGKNGIDAYNAVNDEVMSLVVGEGNL
jgi:hypothetical protein